MSDLTSVIDEYEEKLENCIELLEKKSVKIRIDALKSAKLGLSKKFAYEIVSKWYKTLSEGLERCIKRGSCEEKAVAAVCLCPLIMQLGHSGKNEELYESFCPMLSNIISDSSVSVQARCECTAALGLSAFFCLKHLSEINDIMSTFEHIFRESYQPKSNKEAVDPDLLKLHDVALRSWNLLFTIIPDSAVSKYIDIYMSPIVSMLNSSDMNLRLAAGETLAIMFERGNSDNNLMDMRPEYDNLMKLLRMLATVHSKSEAKKDKVVQRSIFREIYKMVETGEFDDFNIKISENEQMTIGSWSSKIKYDSLCKVLGTGMKTHLQDNPWLRDIFSLEDPIVGGDPLMRGKGKLSNKALTKSRHMERTIKMTNNNYLTDYD